jgi:hypothetical protein
MFKGDEQVVFLGDSINEGWSYTTKNFGLFGNTTGQMLERSSSKNSANVSRKTSSRQRLMGSLASMRGVLLSRTGTRMSSVYVHTAKIN